MLKKTLILFIVLTAASTAFCQGSTGFETLRAEVGGRGSAMASAMIAMDSGIESLFYNPASLGEVDNHRFKATYLNHLLDIESGFFAYGQRLKNWGTFGIGLNYMNYGVFHVTTPYGVETEETFRPTDLLFTLGYGRKMFDLVSLGVNVKYIRSEIHNVSSSAAAVDLGGMVYTPFNGTKIGFGVFNLGRTLDGFYEHKDELPLAYKIGLSTPLEHLPLVVALQLEKYKDSDIYISAGGEFTLSEMFRLRLGWSTRGQDQHMDTDKDVLAGATVGVGLQVSGVIVDFSLVSMGELGTLKRFSLGGMF